MQHATQQTQQQTPSGILIVDKPSGLTSHDVVGAVRRVAKTKKVGHAGTLDPTATGVLVLAIGQATRTLEYLTSHDKRYTATVRLGQSTTTYDAEGEMVGLFDRPLPPREDVEAVLGHFRGEIEQVPPIYSAIKQGGQPLYAKARRGETVEVAARPVIIYELTLTGWDPPDFELEIHCSKGTYIRSLAHDIGQALEVGGHLTALRRTASGSFTIEQAHTLDEIKAASTAEVVSWLLPVGAGLEGLPTLVVTADEIVDLQMGRVLPAEGGAGVVRAVDEAGALVAILEWRDNKGGWQPIKVLQ